LSSWGFLLLGSPLLLAYGIVAEAPWFYYVLLPPFMVAFVYLPATVGATICLALIYWLPGCRAKMLGLGVVLFFVGIALVVWRVIAGPESDLLTAGWFQEMLSRLRFTQGRLLPSWWLSSGLLEAAAHNWSQSVMFLALMISNALLGRQLALAVAKRLYRPAYSALRSEGRTRRKVRPGVGWFDRVVLAMTRPLPLPVRLLMVKDLRVFRRDPVQWSQFLIFFGLLALYFVNIRRFSYDVYYIGWVNMVSFLNLAVVGLLMSTFTTRFIFPMVSLEGRRFWILGLLPIRRDTILWGKFLFAAGGAIVPCCSLVLLSDAMLRIRPIVLVSHQVTCAILCLGLAGIAVGLGARLPNLRQQSPSRIAAGFGGTLNLIVSTLYILAVVLLTAVPTHLYLTAHGNRVIEIFSREIELEVWLLWWLGAGNVASIILGLIATIIPMRIGVRAFRKLEF
jgi:ABC-2 type transport system permease protein